MNLKLKEAQDFNDQVKTRTISALSEKDEEHARALDEKAAEILAKDGEIQKLMGEVTELSAAKESAENLLKAGNDAEPLDRVWARFTLDICSSTFRAQKKA